MNSVIIILLYTIINSTGLALVKLGISSQKIHGVMSILGALFTLKVFLGYTLIAISALIGIKALSMTKFSVFTPIALGFSIIITLLISSLLMKETITLNVYLGIALIVIGVLLVSR